MKKLARIAMMHGGRIDARRIGRIPGLRNREKGPGNLFLAKQVNEVNWAGRPRTPEETRSAGSSSYPAAVSAILPARLGPILAIINSSSGTVP